jgi:predicted ester cyclase
MEDSTQHDYQDESVAANKELVRSFYQRVFVDWDLALVKQVVHPQFRSHDWSADSATGPQGFMDFYEGVRAAFPDTRYVIDDLIAEGDRVVVRWRLLGTHQGEFYGVPPTAGSISLEGIAIYRVTKGMLMERWVVYDLHGLIQQVKAHAANL